MTKILVDVLKVTFMNSEKITAWKITACNFFPHYEELFSAK